MPIYEFSCQSCGAEFEMVRSFSDSTMPVCPKCASVDVQRLLSRPAIHFKGSGWYINDSKNSSKTSSTGTSSTAESSDSATPSETKAGETKSEETKPTESTEKAAKPAKPAETVTPKANSD